MGIQQPYTEAVNTGQYVKRSGLSGKYDNVRRFWEDEVTRLFIRPYLSEIVSEKAKKLERLKILDLGCGAGDGYELLMGTTTKDVGIYEYEVKLIDQELLGFYKGIDINKDLLYQASDLYSTNEKISFEEGDFTQGLPTDEGPFDIYFTSYGTLSHNHDNETIQLLRDIALNCKEHTLVICDWLGRHSYEWQDLWEDTPYRETFMDYKISYIYPPEERAKANIESFPLRIMSRDEVFRIIKEASDQAHIEIKVKKLFDRSIFVGRHMDTTDYNRYCPPIRNTINSLLEPNLRTDLTSLVIDYISKKGHMRLNNFFEGFAMCWNRLIKHTIDFLSEFQLHASHEDDPYDIYTFYPDPLKNAVTTIKNVIHATGTLPGDSRANIIEPQLAYALRKLEMDMQPGLGIGHGLIAILEIHR
ncbi:MAG: class I SAM-dependent methyltransferase [bacterium]